MGTICWKCGSEVPDGAAACSKCGAAVAGTGGQAAQSFAAAAPPSFGAAAPPSAAPGQGYSSPPPPPSTPYQSVASPQPPAFTPAPTPQQGFAPVQQGYTPTPPPPPPSYASATPPPPQQGYSPAPPPPPGSAPVQAASGGKGGSTAVKIILIVVGVIVFFIMLVVGIVGYIGYRAVHAVREAAHGGSVTIPGSSGGSFSVNAGKSYSAEELGTDIYPGATPTAGGMKMNLPNGSWVQSVFLTSDSKDQVVAYYKDKFGSDGSLMDTGRGAIVTLKKNDKDTVMVTVAEGEPQSDGKTKLIILHTTSK